jgi:hypothetical protein
MNANLWHERFMEILNEKFPQKNQLLEELCTLLCIERPAVYRRMRNDVPFTANEVAIIAANWGISLDDILGIYSGKIAFQMSPVNYIHPTKQDIKNLRARVHALENLKKSPNSEYMVVSNNLSRSLVSGFDYLYKFNIFKWGYEFSTDSINFSNLIISDEIHDIIRNFYRNMKDATVTNIILDRLLFENFVSEVLFFNSILLISDEEKELIKKDLINLVAYLLEVANTGRFPETNNKVYLYISTLAENTNYSYVITEQFKICRVHAFNKYDIVSSNPEMIETFKLWMQMKKRTSNLISEVDEISRVTYFKKLYALIDTL